MTSFDEIEALKMQNEALLFTISFLLMFFAVIYVIII